MVRGIANSKIGFGDLILLLRYFFKLKVSTHPSSNKTFENVKLQLNKFRELRAIIKEENKFLQECFRNSNFKNEIQTFDKAIFSLQSQFSDLVNNFENIKGNTKVPILDEETNPFIRFKRELMKYALYEK
ncbi:hypothetical protein L1A45_15245 [Acinetobacter variabilis]|uniref:hypothetical protein n=1 Tax=Acinetobacter variabilis TaxID=70346 RepID=UPI0037705636